MQHTVSYFNSTHNLGVVPPAASIRLVVKECVLYRHTVSYFNSMHGFGVVPPAARA